MRTPIALLLVFFALPAFADPTTYTVDPVKSEVVVRLYKGGIASGLAHDHVIQAKDFKGTFVYDPDDLKNCEIKVTVQAASLIADPPDLVKKYKLSSSPSESDRKAIEKTMKSDEQLDVKKHPTITFVSTKFAKLKDSIYLTGKFTLHGVTKTVTFLVTINRKKNGTVHGKGRFKVKQSDYGYEPYSALMGALKVKDTGHVQIDLVAAPPKKKKD